ncbi:hypothetical protein CLAFUW4_13219 [Fulvia fulva]|uniref:Uncharacterized protein n=1 Tax=Passalora fulva TaxID=5499 RepID=A0A9Q8UVA4_PASFU|nr:uncharacterized protein CLAFUR5_13075 [Fulvia fulva]KAK4611983.1 hypothetical protein CLAFUR4_13224 [Fulvia fulva]UJO23667.1 hypothetical protein CLAFUR5_13075 [Fulvia fulva]WPV21067.1 hypothetical protein CLAFUW4_13219 [Fulvia fulva]WPV36272.1 hypothetical protein CLAFUW7_13226 [Fulvia fulva]
MSQRQYQQYLSVTNISTTTTRSNDRPSIESVLSKDKTSNTPSSRPSSRPSYETEEWLSYSSYPSSISSRRRSSSGGSWSYDTHRLSPEERKLKESGPLDEVKKRKAVEKLMGYGCMKGI